MLGIKKQQIDELVLGAVVGLPAHGHTVCARLGTGVPEGTVYPVLHRLERLGLVRSAWAEVDGRRRRMYEVTGAGAAAVVERPAAAAGRRAARLRFSA